MKEFVVKQLERQLGFERGVDEILAMECESRERFCQEQVEMLADTFSDHLTSASVSAANAMGETDKLIEDSFTSRNVGWWQLEAQSVQSLYETVEGQSTEDQEMLTAQDRASYFMYMQHLVNNTVRSFNMRRRQAECQGKRRLQTLRRHNTDRIQRHISSVMTNPRDGSHRAWGHERAYAARETDSMFGMSPGHEINGIDDPEASLDQFDPMLSDSEDEDSGTESLASLATEYPPSEIDEESDEEFSSDIEADPGDAGPESVHSSQCDPPRESRNT